MGETALQTFLRGLGERRKRLKMPLDILARRSGLSRATVHRALAGDDSLGFVKAAALADALGVAVKSRPTKRGVALEFLPTGVENFIEGQARRQAERLVGMTQGTMGLEAQAVDAAGASELVEKTYRRLVRGPWKRLWYEE